MWVGKRRIKLDIVDSTNEYAKRLISAGLALDGDIICAEEQTAGHGKGKRMWFSPEGGLYLSAIIDGKYKSPFITSAIAVAVSNAIGNNVELKWPNDLMYSGKKLGGILTEEFNGFLIIGIGINTFSESLLDGELRLLATSVEMDKNEKERLVEKIIKELNRVLRRLKRKGSTDLARRWNEKAYRLGEEIFITMGNSTIKGRFAGINEAGHLLLEMGNEKISVEYGEVNFVSDSGKC